MRGKRSRSVEFDRAVICQGNSVFPLPQIEQNFYFVQFLVLLRNLLSPRTKTAIGSLYGHPTAEKNKTTVLLAIGTGLCSHQPTAPADGGSLSNAVGMLLRLPDANRRSLDLLFQPLWASPSVLTMPLPLRVSFRSERIFDYAI